MQCRRYRRHGYFTGVILQQLETFRDELKPWPAQVQPPFYIFFYF